MILTGAVTSGIDVSSSILSGGSVFFRLILVAMVLGLVGFLFWKKKAYAYEVLILTKGTSIFGKDTARLVKKKDGFRGMHLWKNKTIIPIPSFDYTLQSRKGKMLILYKHSTDDWVHVKFLPSSTVQKTGDALNLDDPRGVFQPLPINLSNWHIQKHKRIASKYAKSSFIEKYGVIISLSIVLVMFILGMYFIVGLTTDTVTQVTTQSGQIVSDCVGQALSQLSSAKGF